jgi:hypothetical protein
MIHNCTRCELRFPSESELKEHLRLDHATDTEGLDRYRYAGAHELPSLYPDPPEEERS